MPCTGGGTVARLVRAVRLMEHAAGLAAAHGACRHVGVLAPEFDLTPYTHAPPDLVERRAQLGSAGPKVSPGAVGLSDFRKRLQSFFDVYALEIRDHGTPPGTRCPCSFPTMRKGASRRRVHAGR